MRKNGLPPAPDEEEIAQIAVDHVIKKAVQDMGGEIVPVDEFIAGIEFYSTTPFSKMVADAKTVIDAYDPQLLMKSGIDVTGDVEGKLKKLYPDSDQLKSALHRFKVMFHHIAYFLKINEPEELRHAISVCRGVLNGKLYGEEEEFVREISRKVRANDPTKEN